MRQGYIREPEDIKYLILYSLNLFPVTVTEEELMETVMVDDGFGYFEFAQAFRELIDSRHISEIEEDGVKKYLLSSKGIQVVRLMEGHLKASVCDKSADIASVSLLVYNERQCRILEENFKENAEHIFKGILNLLLNERQKNNPED